MNNPDNPNPINETPNPVNEIPNPVNEIPNPVNTSATSNDNLMALLSYLFAPVVGIIVLLIDSMKNNPVLRSHAIQSIALAVVLFVVSFLLTVVTGGLASCVAPLLVIGAQIYYGIQAYQGKPINIPFVTDFCKKQGWIA